MPLAEDAWSPGLVAYGLPESALQPPVRGAARGDLRNRWELVFNTQPRLRDRLLDLVEDHGSSPLWDHVDRAAVKALLGRDADRAPRAVPPPGRAGPSLPLAPDRDPAPHAGPGPKGPPLVLLEQDADRAFLYDQRRKCRLDQPDPTCPASSPTRWRSTSSPATSGCGGPGSRAGSRLASWAGWRAGSPRRTVPGWSCASSCGRESRTIRVLPTLPGNDPSGRPVRTFAADPEEPGREIEVWVADGGHCLGAVHMPHAVRWRTREAMMVEVSVGNTCATKMLRIRLPFGPSVSGQFLVIPSAFLSLPVLRARACVLYCPPCAVASGGGHEPDHRGDADPQYR